MRRTFSDLQVSRIPQELGICATHPALAPWTNNAQERLLNKGHWINTTVRVAMCATSGCVTLPVQVATLEKAAICGRPIPVHDIYFEFLEGGWGTRNGSNASCASGTGSGTCGGGGSCGIQEADYRGRFPTQSDIIPLKKQLNFVCDFSTDVGKTVLALGYDDNGNWIRTQQNGIYQDGELIALAQSAGTNSVNNFSLITDIQLPGNMDGQSWLYEYDTVALTRRLISHYQYFETRPSYPRYFIPSINACQLAANLSCPSMLIEAIVKLAFIPVKNPTDYLIIENLPAMQEMMVGIKNAENEEDGVKRQGIIESATASAVNLLNEEADHYLGSGRRIGMEVVGSSLGDIQPVENLF
jgi:hypothetical protein